MITINIGLVTQHLSAAAAEIYIVNADGSLININSWSSGEINGVDAQSLFDHLNALSAKKTVTCSIRKKICANVGDDSSLLGTAADAAALSNRLLHDIAIGLANAQSLAEVRAAAQPIADLLAPISAEGVQLTCDLKGRATVVADICQRSTAVSAVLAEVTNNA